MEEKGPVDLSTSKVISDTFFVSISKIGILLLKPIRGIVLGRILGPALYGMLNIPAVPQEGQTPTFSRPCNSSVFKRGSRPTSITLCIGALYCVRHAGQATETI